MEEHVCWILENPTDFYGILQVERDADDAVIRKKYYTLALKMHPDKNGGNAQASEAFRLVRHAYDTLSDPQKRKIYSFLGAKGVQSYESNEEVEVKFWALCCVVLIAVGLFCCEWAARVEHQTEVFNKRLMELFDGKWNIEEHINKNTFEHKNEVERAVARKRGKQLFCAMILVAVLYIAVSSSITYYAAREEWRREHVLFAESQGWFTSPYLFTYNLQKENLHSHHLETQMYCSELHNFSIMNKLACNDTSLCAQSDLYNAVWHVHQYYSTSNDAIRALGAYLEMRCLTEMELWHASLQRYNTSSLSPLLQSTMSSEWESASSEELNTTEESVSNDSVIDGEVHSSAQEHGMQQEEGNVNSNIGNISVDSSNNSIGNVTKCRCKRGNCRHSKCANAKLKCKHYQRSNRCNNKTVSK